MPLKLRPPRPRADRKAFQRLWKRGLDFLLPTVGDSQCHGRVQNPIRRDSSFRTTPLVAEDLHQPAMVGRRKSQRGDHLQIHDKRGLPGDKPGRIFLEEVGILLTDAAPRNVRIVEGRAVPFDAIAEVAEDEVVRWIRK